MATYLKQITRTLAEIIEKEDIDILSESLCRKINEDALLCGEYSDISNMDKGIFTMYIKQFWRTVLIGNQSRKIASPPSSVYYLNSAFAQNWKELFCQIIDENFSGIIAETLKSKVATNIHRFADAMTLFGQKENNYAAA